MRGSGQGLLALVAAVFVVAAAQGELDHPEHDCQFDEATLSFALDARSQALCLLRPLERFGRSGPKLERLPAFLDRHVGLPLEDDGTSRLDLIRALALWLEREGISPEEVGGDLSKPLSSTEEEFGPAMPARYFVLHDTSHPNLLDSRAFPSDMNSPTWEHNRVETWQQGEDSKAHVFVGRDGSSATAIEFSRGWRATKLESAVVGTASRGRFLHVEHVQPRRTAAEGPPGNDGIAPSPGFTGAQLERSALLYVVAGVRSGWWMIPAYHHNVDAAIAEAHDDPQNFDLEVWSEKVEQIWLELRSFR